MPPGPLGLVPPGRMQGFLLSKVAVQIGNGPDWVFKFLRSSAGSDAGETVVVEVEVVEEVTVGGVGTTVWKVK